MDKSGVNHAIGGGGAAAQGVKIFEIAAMDLGAGGGERLGG
jgi:hypothetical protein